MKLTLLQLAAAVGSGVVRAQNYLPHINLALDIYQINTPRRTAAFLAQVGHESCGLRYTTELWGPTAAQQTYERDFTASWPPCVPPLQEGDRNWKAYHLGNVKAGDGFLMRGHGLMQNTGRANHARARDRLRVRFGLRVPDFEAEPHRLAEPEWAALAAGDYWDEHKLNAVADVNTPESFKAMTRTINGALTGLPDRIARLFSAEKALA